MKKLSKKIYFAAGYNTISMGSGRKEFNPKAPMPGFEDYLREAGREVFSQLPNPQVIDESVISNFMAGRFLKQGNLAGFVPMLHPALHTKPATRVEGACASGGLALAAATRSVLSGLSDATFAIGFEVQNVCKAVYGADILASAAYYKAERKDGHAYFFPSIFSERAGAYVKKYGTERTRLGMAHWYAQAIENARRCPKAQEFHNQSEHLVELALTPPNPKTFLEHLNYFDCSKVSDGASGIVCLSEEGLKHSGVEKSRCMELVGIGQAERDITARPDDLTVMETSQRAVERALAMAGISIRDIGYTEVHDCFSISGLLALEALGFADRGCAADLVQSGATKISGAHPVNASGGLIGFGHYTGGTGIRQAVDILDQINNTAGDMQISWSSDRPYALMCSMGGNDVTVVAMVFRKAV